MYYCTQISDSRNYGWQTYINVSRSFVSAYHLLSFALVTFIFFIKLVFMSPIALKLLNTFILVLQSSEATFLHSLNSNTRTKVSSIIDHWMKLPNAKVFILAAFLLVPYAVVIHLRVWIRYFQEDFEFSNMVFELN